MNEADLTHDVFLSHSSKAKAVARASSLSASSGERAGVRCRGFRLEERLRQDRLKVWFEETEIRNPNPQIRNESESPNERNSKQAPQHPTVHFPVSLLGEFELVSDFGFRDSDFKPGPPGLSA